MQTKEFQVTHSDAEWRRLLTPEQYEIMRQHGTEAPGSCVLLNQEKRSGVFACAGCGQPLFGSKKKFESGTGWPSFNDPIEDALETSDDNRHGMHRTEAHCSRCGSHLGHVFPDGPPPTHLRYCINGVAMNFLPE
jgi:peptide-methionine (R)-S-oxide reductase